MTKFKCYQAYLAHHKLADKAQARGKCLTVGGTALAPACTVQARTVPARTVPARRAPACTAPARMVPACTAPACTAPACTAPARMAQVVCSLDLVPERRHERTGLKMEPLLLPQVHFGGRKRLVRTCSRLPVSQVLMFKTASITITNKRDWCMT